jgi:hypothetical protein
MDSLMALNKVVSILLVLVQLSILVVPQEVTSSYLAAPLMTFAFTTVH